VQRACDQCGRPYEAQRATSRFCSTSCRVRAHDVGNTPAESPDGASAPLALVAGDPHVPDVAAATRKALEDAGRVDTPLGQAVLLLALRLDHSHRETGSSVATLAKQYAAQLELALADAGKSGDAMDELRGLRDRKLNAG
jgi:hypothetical protein